MSNNKSTTRAGIIGVSVLTCFTLVLLAVGDLFYMYMPDTSSTESIVAMAVPSIGIALLVSIWLGVYISSLKY